MNALHKLTIVEPIDMVALLKDKMQEDVNVSPLTALMSTESFDYIYRLISKDIDRNASDFNELMEIIEHCKDMNLNQRCGEIITHIESSPMLKRQYEYFKREGKSDHSGASDQDNR